MSVNVKKSTDTNPLPDPLEGGGSDLVEGPGRQCTIGDCGSKPFNANNAKEWADHLRSHKNAYQQGVAPCVICGNEVDLSEVRVRAGNKAIHPDCVPELETTTK